MVNVDLPSLESAEQAEDAFYRAFQARDLQAMMAVWSDEDDIVCIHPQGPRLEGYEKIRDSWEQILENSPPMQFQLSKLRCIGSGSMSVRYVNENIYLPQGEQPQFTILATNIYRLTGKGWRIILHHASPTPESLRNLQQVGSEDEDADVTVH